MKRFTVFALLLCLCGVIIGCGGLCTALKEHSGRQRAVELSQADFEQIILPALQRGCERCHKALFDDYEFVLSIVSEGYPEKSKLYRKANGGLGHAPVWFSGSEDLEALGKWIVGKPLTETP
jgi:hypothetical protein